MMRISKECAYPNCGKDNYAFLIDVSLAGAGLSEYLYTNTISWNQEDPGMKHPLLVIPGITILLLTFTSITALHCASAPAQRKDPAGIVTKSCSNCHGIDKVCSKLGRKDKNAWTRTVYGMKQAGARIDENDIPMLAEYLAGLKPGSKQVCRQLYPDRSHARGPCLNSALSALALSAFGSPEVSGLMKSSAGGFRPGAF